MFKDNGLEIEEPMERLACDPDKYTFKNLDLNAASDLTEIKEICQKHHEYEFRNCRFDSVDFTHLFKGNKLITKVARFKNCSFEGRCNFTEMYKDCKNIYDLTYLRTMFVSNGTNNTSTILSYKSGGSTCNCSDSCGNSCCDSCNCASKSAANQRPATASKSAASQQQVVERSDAETAETTSCRTEITFVTVDAENYKLLANGKELFVVNKQSNIVTIASKKSFSIEYANGIYDSDVAEINYDDGAVVMDTRNNRIELQIANSADSAATSQPFTIVYNADVYIYNDTVNDKLLQVDFSNCFMGCPNITSAVMLHYMFAHCVKLDYVILDYMFYSLLEIDNSRFYKDAAGNTRFVNFEMDHMFYDCPMLQHVNFCEMFRSCYFVKATRSKYGTDEIHETVFMDLHEAFGKCSRIKLIAFDRCFNDLTNIISNENMEKLIDLSYMCFECNEIKTLSLNSLCDNLGGLYYGMKYVDFTNCFKNILNRNKYLNITYSGQLLGMILGNSNRGVPVFDNTQYDNIFGFELKDIEKSIVTITYKLNGVKSIDRNENVSEKIEL